MICDSHMKSVLFNLEQWPSEGGGRGAGPRAQALEGAPAQLQRSSQVSLAGGADRIPGGGDKPQYL